MLPARKTILDFTTITSGVLGRLALSVVYFLIVANALTLGDFGVFASASAVGLVLSRLLGFGFISPVYRIATVKPRLLGTYTTGLIGFGALSVPVIAGIAIIVHTLAFSGKITLAWFLLLIGVEALCWRVVECVIIMLNGLSRFARAAALVIVGSALRTAAALVFLAIPWRGLEAWIVLYAFANAITLGVALLLFVPEMRLRWVGKLYPRRLKDAVSAAFSELTFYVQSELDKLLVLAMAGDKTAGLYAIAMRLIDLTAIPIRSYNQMLVQKLMRDGGISAELRRPVLVEVLIAGVSTAGLAALILLIWIDPMVLGRNIAQVAPFLPLMIAVPALRNLIEYHAELLYAREHVLTRATLLAGLAIAKLTMIAGLISLFGGFEAWALPLTAVYAVLYILSALVTYRAISRPVR
jgi:O-antigen/teichoic acid export membrane protein